jgi:hypothetical protein
MSPDQLLRPDCRVPSICFGLLTAKIASEKGGSFVLWFIAGALLAINALPLAIFLRPEQIGPASFKKGGVAPDICYFQPTWAPPKSRPNPK